MRFIFKTDYAQDLRLAKHPGHIFWYSALMLTLAAAPVLMEEYWLAQLTYVLIYSVVGLGLMLLAGFTGLFSLGHAAFLGVGAYTQAVLTNHGVPFPLALAMSAGLSALAGVTGGNSGLNVKPPDVFGWVVGSGSEFYYLCLVITVVATLGVLNLLRSPTGRAFVAIRDSEISAQSMGIHLAYYKTLSFAISAALAGIGGALYAHNLRFLSPDQFNIIQSIDLLLMVVIGGLGSIHGVFFGAVFLITMPQLISASKGLLPTIVAEAPGLKSAVYGAVLVLFVLFEPMGMYGRWLKIRTYFSLFPFYRKGMFKRQKSFQKSDRLK
jgi:branched-chain amino acid transport system permease protein